jgi:hypothetical protein
VKPSKGVLSVVGPVRAAVGLSIWRVWLRLGSLAGLVVPCSSASKRASINWSIDATLGSSRWFGGLVCWGAGVFLGSTIPEVVFVPRFEGACGFGGVFLGWGVGEGSARAILRVVGLVACPRGVSTGEGVHLAALGRLILRGIGVSGLTPRPCVSYLL